MLEGKTEIGRITDNCETLPIFSDRKLVIVKNSGLFKPEKKAGEASKETAKKVKSGSGKEKSRNDDLTAALPGFARARVPGFLRA